jgi:hypothetical protein
MDEPRERTINPSPVVCRLLPAAAFGKAQPQACMHDQQQDFSRISSDKEPRKQAWFREYTYADNES